MLNTLRTKDGKIDYKKYIEHIKASDDVIGGTQWTDQFRIDIMMEAPEIKFIDPLLIKSYTLQYNGVTVDLSKIGSGYANQIIGTEPLSISVVFREQATDIITDFLLKDKQGKMIAPNDGTYLLPYEYYFSISCFMLDAKWEAKHLVSGEFLYNGQITKDFTSDGGQMLEVVAEFKPILSSQLNFKG